MKMTPNWPTKQEMLNTIWDHFILKKSPPGAENGHCQYLNEKTGAKCAIGLFLTPLEAKHAASSCNGAESIQDLIEDGILGAPNNMVTFLAQVQLAHDKASITREHFYEDFAADLHYLAGLHDLTVPK